MEWLLNRRRMMLNKVAPPAYLTFEDINIWTACCNAWGDHNKTVITDNGNNTVNIVKTFESMLNTTVNKSKIIDEQNNVDNSGGTYIEGTTYEPIGILQEQCEAVTALGTYLRNIGTGLLFPELKYFTSVTTVSTNSPLRGNVFSKIKFPISLRTADVYYTIYSSCRILDFPASTTISWFYSQNISNVEVLIIRNSTLQKGSDASRLRNDIEIYVPAELVDSYKEDSIWIARANNIYAIEGSNYEVFNDWE